jgi:hypothetical protein
MSPLMLVHQAASGSRVDMILPAHSQAAYLHTDTASGIWHCQLQIAGCQNCCHWASIWPHLRAVASTVDRDGGCEVRSGRLERLPGVGSHQLAQLARVAEGDGAQAMLYALRLHTSPGFLTPPCMCEALVRMYQSSS